jgi:hypothetical protein
MSFETPQADAEAIRIKRKIAASGAILCLGKEPSLLRIATTVPLSQCSANEKEKPPPNGFARKALKSGGWLLIARTVDSLEPRKLNVLLVCLVVPEDSNSVDAVGNRQLSTGAHTQAAIRCATYQCGFRANAQTASPHDGFPELN